MADDSQTISFRVPAGLARQLEEAGAKDGLSRNEHARKLVIAALAGPTPQDLLAEIQELHGTLRASKAFRLTEDLGTTAQIATLSAQLAALRTDLATGVMCLLVQAASVAPEEATAWVRQHMFSATP